MKIKSVEMVTQIVFYVDTDEDDYNCYRRYADGSWELLMGESWESVYIKEAELEEAFRLAQRAHPTNFLPLPLG